MQQVHWYYTALIYCISHVMNEWLGKTRRLETGELCSSTEPIGWCACATERITPRDDSFFSSHIKDLFKMNESFKTDPSLLGNLVSAVNSLLEFNLGLFFTQRFRILRFQNTWNIVHELYGAFSSHFYGVCLSFWNSNQKCTFYVLQRDKNCVWMIKCAFFVCELFLAISA